MNGPVLRLLDANANRAREALRVIEDYARFILNSESLCADLKTLRHDLTTATQRILADAIYHRDTPGDVGTLISTPGEAARADLSHVVIAAGKRLGEALRAIEEGLKVVSPTDAPQVEAIRYRSYAIEQRVAFTLSPAVSRFAHVRLYILITASLCKGDWLETARQAIAGGADCLQLREKDLESGELLRRARDLVALCRNHGVLCIINDRPDIALLSGADGVHVGQGDLPVLEVRKLLGNEKIVGVSTHILDQARQAVLDGASYIGVGPFFPSATKPRDFLAGPAYARAVSEQIKLPAVAIGGITPANVDEVLAAGLNAVAVSSAVISAPDVRSAAEALKRALVSRGELKA